MFPIDLKSSLSITGSASKVTKILPFRSYETELSGYTDLTSIPMPKLGGKCWVLDRKGQFLLEAGPGTLRTIACTGAGSGTLHILDGFPDENGEISVEDGKIWQLYKANPVVMGSWMLDAGFNNGLTVRHYGGQNGAPCVASIVWLPYRAAKKA